MNILRFIEIFVIMLGIILVYDARPITKKIFGFGDQNEATMGLKITGFVLIVIAGILFLI